MHSNLEKKVRQYVEDAVAKPYSNIIRTIDYITPFPINCSEPTKIEQC